MVSLEVLPVKGEMTPEGCFLVLFKDDFPTEAPLATSKRRAKSVRAEAEHSEAIIARLEHELASSHAHLHALIEQHDSASEELQSANEEAQSANEELQSINEELSTSKEEIQSSNEELMTVNDELHNRNMELGQTNSDLTNLIGSVQVAIVIEIGRAHV